jgi:hypothetical protein
MALRDSIWIDENIGPPIYPFLGGTINFNYWAGSGVSPALILSAFISSHQNFNVASNQNILSNQEFVTDWSTLIDNRVFTNQILSIIYDEAISTLINFPIENKKELAGVAQGSNSPIIIRKKRRFNRSGFRPDIFTINHESSLYNNLQLACLGKTKYGYCYDFSRYSYDLPLSGVDQQFSPSLKRKVLKFYGEGSTIFSAGTNLNITNKCTFSGWIKPGVSGVSQMILTKYGTGIPYGTSFYIVYNNTSSLTFVISVDGLYTYSTTSTAKIGLNEWGHFVATYDGNKIQLWINGKKNATSTNISGNINSSSIPIGIGCSYGRTKSSFNGEISDIIVHNRKLSDLEIGILSNIKNINYGDFILEHCDHWIGGNLSGNNFIQQMEFINNLEYKSDISKNNVFNIVSTMGSLSNCVFNIDSWLEISIEIVSNGVFLLGARDSSWILDTRNTNWTLTAQENEWTQNEQLQSWTLDSSLAKWTLNQR